MLFADTRPTPADAEGAAVRRADFRVGPARERLALLRTLRDRALPLTLIGPGDGSLASTLWTVDEARGRLGFAVDEGDPRLDGFVSADEAVAVAFLDSVKLQFDLHGLLLVRGAGRCALQCALPAEIYRVQRRGAFRVRTLEQHGPTARLRHPALPDMAVALRVLDVSAGGCALLLPDDVPPLQPGIRIAGVAIELDADTRFVTTLSLQHVTAIHPDARGVRLGCEWSALDGAAARALQRYVDRTQRRRRLFAGS
jgi:c-di-GMP-binding flagellar brake protein YcgR